MKGNGRTGRRGSATIGLIPAALELGVDEKVQAKTITSLRADGDDRHGLTSPPQNVARTTFTDSFFNSLRSSNANKNNDKVQPKDKISPTAGGGANANAIPEDQEVDDSDLGDATTEIGRTLSKTHISGREVSERVCV